MATWGATTLNITPGTYEPPVATVRVNEIKILPDPSSLSTVASVLQSGGRDRKRARWQGYVTSLANYNTLYDDMAAATERTFTGPDSETLTGIIEFLEVIGYPISGHIKYEISIVES
jgi:hypothetical protein